MRVVWSDEEAGLVLVHDVRDAADPGGHHRPSGGERLDDRHGCPLARRREDDGVADRVPRRDLLLVAEEEAGAGEPEVVRPLLEPLPVVTVADEQQERVDASFPDARQHRQEVVGSLHRRHAPEPPDDELPGRDPEPAPDLAGIPVEADARLELDAEPDDREPVARRDAQAHELVAFR
jgi:hypothetical protein